jgi:hypothetical protein
MRLYIKRPKRINLYTKKHVFRCVEDCEHTFYDAEITEGSLNVEALDAFYMSGVYTNGYNPK